MDRKKGFFRNSLKVTECNGNQFKAGGYSGENVVMTMTILVLIHKSIIIIILIIDFASENKENKTRNIWTFPELKSKVESEGGSNTNYSRSTWNNSQEHRKGSEGTRNLRKNWNCLDHNTTEIGKNTEKSPVDLRRLAVTRTSVKKTPQTPSGLFKSQQVNGGGEIIRKWLSRLKEYIS